MGKLSFLIVGASYLVLGLFGNWRLCKKKMPVKCVAKRQRGESFITKETGPSLNVFVSVVVEE